MAPANTQPPGEQPKATDAPRMRPSQPSLGHRHAASGAEYMAVVLRDRVWKSSVTRKKCSDMECLGLDSEPHQRRSLGPQVTVRSGPSKRPGGARSPAHSKRVKRKGEACICTCHTQCIKDKDTKATGGKELFTKQQPLDSQRISQQQQWEPEDSGKYRQEKPAATSEVKRTP